MRPTPLEPVVCIFLDTGRTFSFRNALVVVDNETVLVIDYIAMSDGRQKQITVQKSAIVGWSVTRVKE